MSKTKRESLIALVALTIVGLSVAAAESAGPPNNDLMGIVKFASGKPADGAAISAQAFGKTFTTTVYSDQKGSYFLPQLDSGHYKIWAQAVGFETGKAELDVSPGKKLQQDFTLKILPDFHKQLSGTEWLESLPNENPEDRRLAQIISRNCSTCHPANWVLQNRFDAAGWGKILNLMGKITSSGDLQEAGEIRYPVFSTLLQAYQEDLIAYLTRVRGPDPYPLRLKPLPRPTGEAARVRITEYHLPLPDGSDYIMDHDGSDWSEGTPPKLGSSRAHDMALDQQGNVWFSDPLTPQRSIGKLDPKTGRVTGYKLADKNDGTVIIRALAADQKGNMWAANQSEGTILKFDTKTEQFQRFPKPSSMIPGTQQVGEGIAVDSKGNVWATSRTEAFRLKPETGEYTEFQPVTKGGHPYGITVDAEDNAWFAQMAADRLGIVNGRTGEVSEVVLPPLDEEISAKDREIGARSGSDTMAAPLFQKGPRRLAGDRKGDSVWVAEFWTGRLARINIHNKKVTEYRLPHSYSHPYAVAVDKNHMVWIALLNSDRVAKFDPYTERFTEYPLPSLGTETRFITVDDQTEVPTVWIPYNRINKIARIQFRTVPGP